MKKISQLLITALSLALVACGTLGVGDTDVSNNPDFNTYKGICVKYMKARIHAAKCIGQNDEANKLKAQMEQINQSKKPDDLKQVMDNSKMPEMDKTVKLTSAKAKEEFVDSLGYLMGGVAQERLLIEKVLQNIQSLQSQVASNPFGAAASELSFLTGLSDAMASDVKNVAVTIDAYTVYATENGISMDDIKAAAAKAEKSSDLE